MNCPICKGKVYKVGGGTDYCYHLTSEECSVMFCDKCGIAITAPEMSLEQLSKLYPDDYVAYQKQSNVMNILQKYKYRQDIRRIDGFAKENNHKIKKVFEFGAGNGQFLRSFQDYKGVECFGIEMSKAGCNAAKDFFGLELECRTAQNYMFKGTYDLIVMRHVLEHIDEFRDVLNNVYQHGLNENGILFIKVPCFNSYESRRFGRYWKDLDVPRHRVHFTDYGLKGILEKIGFKKIKIIREIIPTVFDGSLQIKKKGCVYKRGGILKLFRALVYYPFLYTKKKEACRMIMLAQK